MEHEQESNDEAVSPELKERATRMVRDLRREDPGDHGVTGRVACQFGIGTESFAFVGQAGRDRRRRAGRAHQRGAQGAG